MKRLHACLLIASVAILHISHAQNSASKWTPLFDGKSLKGWKQVTGTAGYEAVNGEIAGSMTVGSVNSFLVTENVYKDFILELETKIQDSAMNSGIQFRSLLDPVKGRVYGYQYEIDGTARKWSGGIYDEQRRLWLYPVTLNPAARNNYKPGEFNKVRIECKGNIVTTWLNDQPVSYLVDSATTPGFIGLQVHSTRDEALVGKKVYWKNIRIMTDDIVLTPFPKGVFVVNTLLNDLSEQEIKNGVRLLFDGATSKSWKGAYQPGFPEKGWSIKDGVLSVAQSDGGEATNGGDIVTIEKFKAFDFTFDFKLARGANSGVKYFVTLSEGNKGSAIGLEYQLLDDSVHADAKMGRDGNRTMASLYDLIPAVKQTRFFNPPGQWNRGRIVVYPNNRVEHYLNGVKVLEYDRGSKVYRDLVAISKYKVWNNFGEAPEGHLLLQDHGNEVSFKNIKIRELK